MTSLIAHFSARLALLALACLSPVKAQAQPEVALSVGSGTDGDIYSLAVIGYQDFWQRYMGSGWQARAHLETSLTRIDGMGDGRLRVSVLGLTPTLRFEPRLFPAYLEVGIGVGYFDRTKVNESKSVGTNFEFGDIVGLGLKFGDRRQHEIGYRFVHYSNAGISSRNPGVDFHSLRLKSNF